MARCRASWTAALRASSFSQVAPTVRRAGSPMTDIARAKRFAALTIAAASVAAIIYAECFSDNLREKVVSHAFLPSSVVGM